MVGDFNRDGVPDVATANTNAGSVSVLIGNGRAGFGAATSYPVAGHPADVETADFNGDGNADLAVTEQETGKVAILRGAGNGSFGAATRISAAANANQLAVGDLNGDGKADLVVTEGGGTSPTVNVLLGNGNGSFAAIAPYAVSYKPADVTIADMNRDGHPDIVTVGGSPGGVSTCCPGRATEASPAR